METLRDRMEADLKIGCYSPSTRRIRCQGRAANFCSISRSRREWVWSRRFGKSGIPPESRSGDLGSHDRHESPCRQG